jgi:hypothetical protein
MLAACLPTAPSGRDELRHNLGRWEARQPAAYEFVFQRSSCECLPEWTVPLRITVREGRITSVVDLSTGEAGSAEAHRAMSIDDLFSTIERAFDQGAYRVSVSYDRELGHPTSVFLDYGREGVDDEVAFSVGDLRAVN